MWDRLSSAGHGRYSQWAGLASCGLLAVAAVWLLARVVWLLVPGVDSTLAAAPARIAVPAEASSTGSIARWHLFGNTPPRPGTGPGAPTTTLALILRGTLADRDPRIGIAVIGDGQGGERAWRVGEDISPGVRLSEVYADHVVLLHDGAQEILKLPRDRNLASSPAVRATPATASSQVVATPSAAAAAPFQPPQVAHGAVNWQQAMDQLRTDPSQLASQMQIAPVFEGGKMAGVRLSAGANAALLEQAGLRPSDLVTAVNGVPVDSVARGQQILQTLDQASSVRVSIMRDGQPSQITVSLK